MSISSNSRAGEAHARSVPGDVHPLRRDRHDLAVKRGELLDAVHSHAARDQLARIDEVLRPPGMNDGTRVGKLAHQGPRAAGVIQMDVRQQHEIDLLTRDIEPLERFEQARNRAIGTGVDERRSSLLQNQVACVQPRPHIKGVDGVNTVSRRDKRGNFLSHPMT